MVLKDLDSVIAKVHHNNIPISIQTNATWSIKLTWLLASHAKMFKECTFLVKYLHSVVARVSHVNVSLSVNKDALWSNKLSFTAAFPSYEARTLEVCVHNEDAMIVEVGDDNRTTHAETYTSGVIEMFPHGDRVLKPVLFQEDTCTINNNINTHFAIFVIAYKTEP